MITLDDSFNRSALLLGNDVMRRLADTHVIIFGVGGVGSWCAEGLIRSGIGHLTIVDSDSVAVSNINRQAMATSLTVGQPKVDALRERLLAINPTADIVALREKYTKDTAVSFNLGAFDYVVDAIDSLANKIELILHATSVVQTQKAALRAADPSLRDKAVPTKTTFFSAMGAALKTDPSLIRVSEFWEVDGCPLARAIRKRMKSMERFPASKFRCVWSSEVLSNRELPPVGTAAVGNDASKAQINGSLVHITAIFGFTLASMVINHLQSKKDI
jgi:tRNA A37 threonylcarbamoyladenosine dehydratase